MINIFRNLFRKKKAFTPVPMYGPPPLLYGPPSVFDRPLSMTIIPGRLTVLTDSLAGQSFRLFGLKTNHETVLTVGRYVLSHSYNPVEHNANHLKINDSSRTMSRVQFEIIYDLRNTYLKCRSFSNPTLVDGKPLKNNQRVMLHDGSIIKAGYVELRYDI